MGNNNENCTIHQMVLHHCHDINIAEGQRSAINHAHQKRTGPCGKRHWFRETLQKRPKMPETSSRAMS
eukprot:2658974-Amphidinium_carterae.1